MGRVLWDQIVLYPEILWVRTALIAKRRQLLSPPLVFDIVTPSANLISRKSQLPQYPDYPPLCRLEKNIAYRHQEEISL